MHKNLPKKNSIIFQKDLQPPQKNIQTINYHSQSVFRQTLITLHFSPFQIISLNSSRLTLLKCIHTHKNVATRSTRDEKNFCTKKTNHLSMMGKNEKGWSSFCHKRAYRKKIMPSFCLFSLTHSLTYSSYRTFFTTW